MSLAIDVDLVQAVLIGDKWHTVQDDTFTLDSYEFMWWSEHQNKDEDDPMILHAGGNSGVCATGFSFKSVTPGNPPTWISGPLTAVQAVRTRPNT